MRPCLMSKKYTLLTFKGICMNFLLELNFFILSRPVTSKQPHKIVQIHMGHPVNLIMIIIPIGTPIIRVAIIRIPISSNDKNSYLSLIHI